MRKRPKKTFNELRDHAYGRFIFELELSDGSQPEQVRMRLRRAFHAGTQWCRRSAEKEIRLLKIQLAASYRVAAMKDLARQEPC